MKKISLLVLAGILFLFAFAKAPLMPDMSINNSMLNFLPYLNQKVDGYLRENQTVVLNTQTYNEIVKKVCSPLPSCGKNADIMFETYSVQPRMLDGAFSVMLCDKNNTIKIMEDFSCDENRVEIPTFKTNTNAPCKFEDNWKEKVSPFCHEIK